MKGKANEWLKNNWFLLVVIVVGGILIYLIYSFVKKGIVPSLWDLITGGSDAGNVPRHGTLSLPSNMPGKISDEDAKRLSQILYTAMADFGTKDELIEQVYKNLVGRPYAVRQVYNAFGTPNYGYYGSPMFGKGEPMDLWEWLTHEISSSVYKDWYNLFQKAEII